MQPNRYFQRYRLTTIFRRYPFRISGGLLQSWLMYFRDFPQSLHIHYAVVPSVRPRAPTSKSLPTDHVTVSISFNAMYHLHLKQCR